jgi:hypothetical protein
LLDSGFARNQEPVPVIALAQGANEESFAASDAWDETIDGMREAMAQ